MMALSDYGKVTIHTTYRAKKVLLRTNTMYEWILSADILGLLVWWAYYGNRVRILR